MKKNIVILNFVTLACFIIIGYGARLDPKSKNIINTKLGINREMWDSIGVTIGTPAVYWFIREYFVRPFDVNSFADLLLPFVPTLFIVRTWLDSMHKKDDR